jgi:hypothetical protein
VRAERLAVPASATCPACLTPGGRPRFWARGYAIGKPERRYRYLDCGECGALFLWPRPTADEQRAHYPPTYHPQRSRVERIGKGLVQVSTLLQMGLSSPASVLDWGCGQGELVEVLTHLGVHASGFEPFRYAWPAEIVPRIGTTIAEGIAAAADADVIAMLDVLEHVPEPRTLLQTIGECTRASIFVFCPRADGPGIRRFGGKGYTVQAPTHMWLPTMVSLQRIAEGSGWIVESCPQPYTQSDDLSWRIAFGCNVFSAQRAVPLWGRIAPYLVRLALRAWPPSRDSEHVACLLRKA